MTSNYPYSMAMDFTHMYSVRDLRGKFPTKEPCPGTIWAMLVSDPRFTRFRYIVEKAGMQSFFNDPLANYTVFVAADSSLNKYEDVISNMDTLTCRRTLQNSVVRRRLPSEVLKDSPMYYLYTFPSGYSTERINIQNLEGKTLVNGGTCVLEWDILLKNGIVHIVDGLLVPYIV